MMKIKVKKNIIERHSPVGKKDYLSIQHIDRYKFAAEILEPGMKVLDIACGTGYGSAMLINHGCVVTGGDYDVEAVNRAKEVWDYDDFVQADALNLPFEDNSFDAVVTFETIEHVYEHETARFVEEMKRVLKPDGIFICSTPNVNYTFHPDFHLHEFYADEFFDVITKYFDEFTRYGQYFRRIDRLRDLYLRKLLPSFFLKILKLLEQALLKARTGSWSKKAILGGHYDAVFPQEEIDLEEWMEAETNEPMHKKYGVLPYKDDRMCRIMIVVAGNNK